MWIVKLRIKHNCILGNRAKKFKIVLQGSNPIIYSERGKPISSSMIYISGDPQNIDLFIKDLKADKKVKNIERSGDMIFLLERSEEKMVKFFTPKLIFTKPVLIDKEGYETWEIASWERKELEKFVEKVEKSFENYNLLKFNEIKIDNVFFPRLMPNLTKLQKRAIELAIERGYYKTPRSTNLRELAKKMNLSLSTYQQHLRVAEEKLIPNILNYSV